MSNLIPEKRVNKNGVAVTKHVKANTTAKSGKQLPPPTPKVTFAGTMRAMDNLGVDVSSQTTRKNAVKSLVRDPEMAIRVLEAMTNGDAHTRAVWGNTIWRMGSYGEYYNRSEYERMIANNELTARLISSIGYGIIRSPKNFRTDFLAMEIEKKKGIEPGDARYNEVQAAIIYYAVNSPETVSRPNPDMSYLDTNNDDIMTIANNMEKVMDLMPSLFERRDASRHVVHGLASSNAPSLSQGIL